MVLQSLNTSHLVIKIKKCSLNVWWILPVIKNERISSIVLKMESVKNAKQSDMTIIYVKEAKFSGIRLFLRMTQENFENWIINIITNFSELNVLIFEAKKYLLLVDYEKLHVSLKEFLKSVLKSLKSNIIKWFY